MLQGIYSSCFVAPQQIRSSWDDIGGLEAVKEELVCPMFVCRLRSCQAVSDHPVNAAMQSQYRCSQATPHV